MRWSLIELQTFSLSELQIAPIHCVLVNSPRIFVRRDSGFVQIVLFFFYIGFTAVTNTDYLSLLRPSYWYQSALDDGLHVVSVPDVVDVLGDDMRQQYIVLQ